MKRAVSIFSILALLMLPGIICAKELRFSSEIGSIKLEVPEKKEVRQYLGIKQTSGQFRLAEIRKSILIVEIFNMYCPHCQKYAPKVNELYSMINSRADIKNRVMLIGIGVGNSPFEVNIFRKKYSVEFSLFDDKGYSIANRLEGVLTPHFIGMEIDGKGTYRVFYSEAGGFENTEEFLNQILKLSMRK